MGYYKLIYEKVSENIKDPVRVHDGDSGMDIFSPRKTYIKNNSRVTINTGIKFHIPQIIRKENFGLSFELQIRPKSGMSRDGLEVSLGTIDEGYRGWCHVTIANFTGEDIIIDKDRKIAQVVMVPVITDIELIKGVVENNSSRGTGGLGSTGKF